jgi:predicted sulfurtransferase
LPWLPRASAERTTAWAQVQARQLLFLETINAPCASEKAQTKQVSAWLTDIHAIQKVTSDQPINE